MFCKFQEELTVLCRILNCLKKLVDIGTRIQKSCLHGTDLFTGKNLANSAMKKLIKLIIFKIYSYYRQTTSDAIELSEASLDVNLSGANLRCKVAPGTPPLNNITVYERAGSQHVVILAATVSSIHRFVFPHPVVLDKKVNT